MVDVSSNLIEEEIKLTEVTAHDVYESVSRVSTGASVCAPDWHYNLLSGTEQHLMAEISGKRQENSLTHLRRAGFQAFSGGLINLINDYRKCLSSWSQVSNADPSGNWTSLN